MAQTILIKRSSTAVSPGNLPEGELAYSSQQGGRLYIGNPGGGGSQNRIIGGQLYTDMLDHTLGTLTPSSAILVDANSKIDKLLSGTMRFNNTANQIDTSTGNLILDPAASLVVNTGTIDFSAQASEFKLVDNSATGLTISEGSNNYITLVTTNAAEKIVFNKQLHIGTEYTFPTTDGSTGQALITDGSGAVTFTTISTILDIGADTGTNSNVSLISQRLDIVGGTGIDTSVSGQVITITGEDATTATTAGGANRGVASFDSVNFTATNGWIEAKDITLTAEDGSTAAATIGEGFTFTGGEGIDTTANGTTVTITGELASSSNKGVASLHSDDFLVSSGVVTVKASGVTNTQLVNDSVTFGSTTVALGASSTAIAGVTELVVDDLTLDGLEISTTDNNKNISLNPHGVGVVDVNTSRITNVATPTNDTDAANKGYVDAVKQALDIKDSVRVTTTANITIASALNAGDTIDGVTLVNGDRVLVKDQTTGSQNGIYVVGAVPARADDANISAEVTSGMFTFVEEGTVGGDNGFVLTTNDPITLNTTALTFVQFSGAGQVIAGDALVKSGNTLHVNDDNITTEVSNDTLRIKAISATAVGDLLVGKASNGGYTRLVKPSGNATATDYILSMNTAGVASWANTIDGGTFS